MQASADYSARFEAGDKETIKQEEQREMGKAVAFAILSKGLSEFGNLSEGFSSKNTTNSKTNEQVAAANGGKLGGRTIIVDENLSPTIAEKLRANGYKVKVFEKGTGDVDILTYAEKNKAIVLTNNIKDFNKWGITTFKVSENMKKASEADNVVKAIDNINTKTKSNAETISAGKNVSLAENKKN